MKENFNKVQKHSSNIYSDVQKTVELKDDIKAMPKCTRCCHKANSFTSLNY